MMWKYISAMIAAASIVFIGSTSAWAAQAVSPTALDSTRTNDQGTSESTGDQNLYHVLKNETSSRVFDVDMYAYFNTNAPGRFITITDRNTNPVDRCKTTGDQRYGGGTLGDYFVRVTITLMNPGPATPTTDQTVVYNIPRDRVCGATYNTPGSFNGYGSNNSSFFAQYRLPTGFTSSQRDGDTNLYKVRILIDLNKNVPRTSTSASASADRQQVMFKVRTDNTCDPNNCFFSSVPLPDAVRNTSTLGSMDGAEYKRIKMYFGLPCSATTARTSAALRIYDVDQHSGGSSWQSSTPRANRYARFLIEQKPSGGVWSALPAAAYSDIRGADPNAPILYRDPTYGADRAMIRPNDDQGSDTWVHFTMQPKTQYRVTLGPIWSGNLVGFGLPEENIFGKIDCNVAVTGRVQPSPATGPVQTGTDVTFSPFVSRTGSSFFPSDVNHELFVWYETAGNNTYDPADDRIVTPTDCRLHTASRILSDGSEVALPVCPVKVDTSRGGGSAAAICAQLVIGANDALTQVTPPAPVCISIGKRPLLHAANGDVFAGGALSGASCAVTTSPVIMGGLATIGGVNYGSKGTYGVTSLGTLRVFGTNNLISGDPAGANALVISNRTVTNSFGATQGYFYNDNANTNGLPTQARCLNEPFTTFSQGATNGGAVNMVNISDLVGAGGGTFRRTYTATGSSLSVIATQPIPAGTKVVLNIVGATTDVKINGNISYASGPYASIDQLPQVVILSERDITINGGVERIDAILGARRDLITCALPGGPTDRPALGVCDRALQINGAVVTGGKIRPYRTFGGEQSAARGTDYGTPAEMFDFTPNVLLNSLPGPGNTDIYVRTVKEREAPPRF